MKAFRINGSYKDVRHEQKFSIEIAAEDAETAKEKTLSTLGSRHKLKRWEITIADITELKPSEVTDTLVQYEVGEK